jgi:hypothetical protein
MADRGVVLSENEVGAAIGDIQTPPPYDTGYRAAQETPVQNGSQRNIPLTDSQKLTLRTYQSRLTTLAKQKSEIDVQVAKIEGAMQVDMMKIAMTNNIVPEQFGFNDNLEIIPTPKQGQGGPPPRRA